MTCRFDGFGRVVLRRFGRVVVLLLAAASVPLFCRSATALIVDSPTENLTPPGDDPGFYDVVTVGPNYVYLGDCWALSAAHKGVRESGALTFATGTYEVIPGQDYLVPNPAGSGYSTYTDLRLVRLKADPGLNPRPIASAPPSLNDEVTIVSWANHRLPNPTDWDVYKPTGTNPWVWSEVTDGDAHVYIGTKYSGYKATSPGATRWGTNRIARASTVFQGVEGAVVLSTVRAMLPFSGRDVVSIASVFDQSGTLKTDNEAQAIGGDSGGALFRKNGTQWELAGILDATLIYSGQSTGWGVYGDATSYVDLSYYHDEIQTILDAHHNYSILGDVNLDGDVTGDGTGDPASDDVAAFVAGWMYNNGTGQGDITSWKHGDIWGPQDQPDGKTDVFDFLKMRSALSPAGAGSLAGMLGLGGISAVPEPASALLLLIGAAFLLMFRP
jgi:hypothetical protein